MVYEIQKSFLFYLDTRYRSGGSLSRPTPVFTFPNNLIAIDDEKIRLTENTPDGFSIGGQSLTSGFKHTKI